MSARVSYAVGDRVICNGYDGAIRVVHSGQLTGMYDVQLRSGQTCVSGADLAPLFRSELTDAGEQTVIPGCEKDDERTGARQMSLF